MVNIPVSDIHPSVRPSVRRRPSVRLSVCPSAATVRPLGARSSLSPQQKRRPAWRCACRKETKEPSQAPGIPERQCIPSPLQSNLLTQATKAQRPTALHSSLRSRARKPYVLRTCALGLALSPSWPKPIACPMASPGRSASTPEQHALGQATCKFSPKWHHTNYKWHAYPGCRRH